MKIEVTAVFDIGRTNKKFFLFNTDFQEVYREYHHIEEISDEDGYPSENLNALEIWAKEVFERMMNSTEFEITSLNFSCYGASLVHIDENGKVLTPLYNYMKPLSDDIYEEFYDKYGPENELSRITGSIKLGMLNTGMHLYWLKHKRPEVFKKVKYSLHLPQYLSYIFTGIPISEFTSIGCHTLLWDFEKKRYHDWVVNEDIDRVLPPIVPTGKTIPTDYSGKTVNMGPGIHDSSSALIPYVRSISKPFLLVSTGTWSISINPFTKGMLAPSDVQNESMFNMRVDGSPVKVTRLFLGSEYKLQIQFLTEHYGVSKDLHKSIKFDQKVISEITADFKPMFKWISLAVENTLKKTKLLHESFEKAYHQLMYELVLLQVASIESAIGDQKIKRLYIDGGFSDNDVYLKLLLRYLDQMKLRTTNSSLGSALGAAIIISNSKLDPKFLKHNYGVKKHRPVKIV